MSEAASKSDRTRGVILEAARRLFAARGYDGATIREIAAEAGIDPALVIRYFGNKEELFLRAAALELAFPALDLLEQASIGEAVVRHFLGVWEGPGANPAMSALLRGAASNELSATKLREVFATQVSPLLESIGPRSTAALRAGLIASQLLGLALCRYVLKLPSLSEMSAEELVKLSGPTIQRYAFARPEPIKQTSAPIDQSCFSF